jgi:peptidoglycan hydrolase-like protein with peptidoglycan-binding domain
MRGPAVKELQIRIAGWAADAAARDYVAIDGIFGAETERAVKRFQKAYGLAADGIVGPQTQRVLNSLASADGSTAHFNWGEFTSKDGSGFSGGKVGSSEVRENIRRLMWKLEALRKKAGGHPVTVVSGFRSIAHNKAVGGAGNSMHMYGVAADIIVSGLDKRQVAELAKTSGFSGIFLYKTTSHTHVDSRIEYPYGSRFWCWDMNADGHCDG